LVILRYWRNPECKLREILARNFKADPGGFFVEKPQKCVYGPAPLVALTELASWPAWKRQCA
jgi:hypothetical protein